MHIRMEYGKLKSKTGIALCLLCLASAFAALPKAVLAQEMLLWTADVQGDGTPNISPILKHGRDYRIVAKEIFWYDDPANLAADANYYTTDPSNHWMWTSYTYAGQSFLQINGLSVDWGPFSNGDTGHTYTITYAGEGARITFTIVDLIDSDYTNNMCHLPVEIWEQPTTVGGTTVSIETSQIHWWITLNIFILTIIISAKALVKKKDSYIP